MPRNRVMSDRLKEEIAKELGFYEVVERDGWGGITSRDAGNMVKRAVEMAQTGLMNGKNHYKNQQNLFRTDKADQPAFFVLSNKYYFV